MTSNVLGRNARHIVTGFRGVITATATYLSGCVRYLIQPGVDQEGKIPEGHWMDVEEVEILDGGVDLVATPSGGDRKDPPPRNTI